MTTKHVEGVLHPESPPFGFAEWDLNSFQDFRNLLAEGVKGLIAEGDAGADFAERMDESVKKMIEEGLRVALHERYKCDAWFPIVWDFAGEDGDGGPVVSDPTTIYVALPLGADEDSSPRWSFALCDLVDSLIDVGLAGDKLADEHVPSAVAVRDSLRALADRIDGVLP